LIEAEDLWKLYGRVEALRGVSLRIGSGVTGLIGPNGGCQDEGGGSPREAYVPRMGDWL